jgi:NDP-sugar pyrophosphorylase family protein
MRFFRLRSSRTLHGFGDQIADVPLLGEPLAALQRAAVESIGAELCDVTSESDIHDERYIIFDEHVFFSKQAVKAIHRRAEDASESLQFCLRNNNLNRRFVLPSSADSANYLRFPVYYRHNKNGPIVDDYIPQKLYENWARLPHQIMPGGKYHLDHCDTIIATIDTPFHLMQANMYVNLLHSLGIRKLAFWPRNEESPHTNPFLYYAGMRLLNRSGKRCRIHPTAVVEGAVLGDDVVVGAHAVVRLSHIGSGTTIEDQASVAYSVLGKDNFIASQNHVAFCMTYDDVFLIHGPYQFSVFGKGSAVFATINCDVRMDQRTIRIPGQTGLYDSQQHLLGVAYGHGAKMAGGNIVAPGQIVPNGHTQMPPDFIVTKIP